MQVEVDVKCMKTKFRGHGPSGFRDFAPFCLPSIMVKFYFESWTIIHVLTSKTKINIAANIFGLVLVNVILLLSVLVLVLVARL